MATALAMAALMRMAKGNSKRNCGGSHGNGRGGQKGGDGSGNSGGKPNFCRRHHHFCCHRMDAMVNVRPCWPLV